MKILFIGNSATSVHKIPQWLQRVAEAAGHSLEVTQILRGGYMLCQHADIQTEHGRTVFEEIGKGYDLVVLQDNSKCILGRENRENAMDACRRLCDAIHKSGAVPYFYVRPPCGEDVGPYPSLAQCKEYDDLFGTMAERFGARCVYVNRAFAYAIEHLEVTLWGPDNAHTSIYGGYLTICTFFATLMGSSATCLEEAPLEPSEALALQQAADKVALEGYVIP